MSEIEKAREFLDSRWNTHIGGLFGRAREITTAIETLVRNITREEIEAAKGYKPQPAETVVGDFRLSIRADEPNIVIEGAPAPKVDEYLEGIRNRGRECDETGALTEEGGDRDQRDDKSPPAVEAPAAGGCPYCNGSGLFLGGRAAVQIPKFPRCYGSGKAEDVGPRNAVEAAAGDPKEMADRLRSIARDPNNFIPRAGSLIEAAIMLTDTTALARRLAEHVSRAIYWTAHKKPIPSDVEEAMRDDLAEARKAGLIE